MSKWKYIGAGDSPPKNITFYGIDFELGGRGVEIDNPAAEAKMENISSFEKVENRGHRAEGAAIDATKPTNPNKGKPRAAKKVKAKKA